ncbi:hypothetical protein KNP414_07724 [Paenibacillus mucilaginosus KNP414]|uniref:Uncharacterized protein n=1 Tax=Paenibacillus mucilaginosus (strain KNP414) TaxID=1036673 RepID=F8FEX5_PAEMK|nr:hypothetical protein KNP414_07724 [Paenibacillus mucilaginosus KNP414]
MQGFLPLYRAQTPVFKRISPFFQVPMEALHLLYSFSTIYFELQNI